MYNFYTLIYCLKLNVLVMNTLIKVNTHSIIEVYSNQIRLYCHSACTCTVQGNEMQLHTCAHTRKAVSMDCILNIYI